MKFCDIFTATFDKNFEQYLEKSCRNPYKIFILYSKKSCDLFQETLKNDLDFLDASDTLKFFFFVKIIQSFEKLYEFFQNSRNFLILILLPLWFLVWLWLYMLLFLSLNFMTNIIRYVRANFFCIFFYYVLCFGTVYSG